MPPVCRGCCGGCGGCGGGAGGQARRGRRTGADGGGFALARPDVGGARAALGMVLVPVGEVVTHVRQVVG